MDQQDPRVDKYLSSRARNLDSQREPIMGTPRIPGGFSRNWLSPSLFTVATCDAEEAHKKNDIAGDAPVRGTGRDGEGNRVRGEKKFTRRIRPATGNSLFVLSSSSRAVLEPSLLLCHWRVDRVKDEEEDGCEVENRASREREGQLCRFCDGPPQLPATRKCGRDSHTRSGATNSRAPSSSWARRFLGWKIYLRVIINNDAW